MHRQHTYTDSPRSLIYVCVCVCMCRGAGEGEQITKKMR